jgi:hypothetical protein
MSRHRTAAVKSDWSYLYLLLRVRVTRGRAPHTIRTEQRSGTHATCQENGASGGRGLALSTRSSRRPDFRAKKGVRNSAAAEGFNIEWRCGFEESNSIHHARLADVNALRNHGLSGLNLTFRDRPVSPTPAGRALRGAADSRGPPIGRLLRGERCMQSTFLALHRSFTIESLDTGMQER